MRFLLLLALLPFAAWATDPPKPATQAQGQDQNQVQGQGQEQSAVSNQSQSQGNVQTIESERQAPSTFTVAPPSTAPCYYSNGWSVGVPGAGGGRSKARKDAECWAEYVKQAEHARALETAKLDLERQRIAIERDRLKLESERLSICHECEVRK